MAVLMTRISRGLSHVPWQSFMTVEPIEQLVNAPIEQQNERTKAWKEAKLAELSFVGLAVRSYSTTKFTMLIYIQSALVSGVCASAFSWYNITPQPYSVRAVWYSSLLLALVSITIAAQQSGALHRLSSNQDGLAKLRLMLSYKHAGVLKARYSQVYIWQTPVMLLNISICLFLIGLATVVFRTGDTEAEDARVGQHELVNYEETNLRISDKGCLRYCCLFRFSYLPLFYDQPLFCGANSRVAIKPAFNYSNTILPTLLL